jgi:hypothetical protein
MGKTESTEIVVEAAAPSAEAYDPWKDMRSILLPRAGGNEQQSQFCAVNGRTFQVPRGRMTEVPLPIYECLMEAMTAQQEAFEANRADAPK